MSTRTCPICSGSGEMPAGWHDLNEAKARIVMARALYAESYSFREIARLCGWKSERSAVDAVRGRAPLKVKRPKPGKK